MQTVRYDGEFREHEILSISYDNAESVDDPRAPGTRVVLLHVPFIGLDEAHWHIQLSDAAAETLRDWLSAYLAARR